MKPSREESGREPVVQPLWILHFESQVLTRKQKEAELFTLPAAYCLRTAL